MRYLILLLLPAIIIISGCQKQIEETKVENIIDDVRVINNIMKNNIIEYKIKNSINLTKEDVDNITNSIKNVMDNKTYIMIDDELCMIDDNNKINFYSKNKLCKAIKSKN